MVGCTFDPGTRSDAGSTRLKKQPFGCEWVDRERYVFTHFHHRSFDGTQIFDQYLRLQTADTVLRGGDDALMIFDDRGLVTGNTLSVSFGLPFELVYLIWLIGITQLRLLTVVGGKLIVERPQHLSVHRSILRAGAYRQDRTGDKQHPQPGQAFHAFYSALRDGEMLTRSSAGR